MSREFGMIGPYVSHGPLPLYDHCAYEVVVQILRASLFPGRNVTTHVQFEMIRKVRSNYSNWYRSSAEFVNS